MTRNTVFAAAALMAAGSRIALAADDAAATGAPAPAPVNPGVAEFEFPNLPGKRSFDCGLIPSEVRLDFLKGAVRAYIANRLNGVHTRYEKDEKVLAWKAYDAASAADALQTAVPKPEGDRPAPADYEAAYAAAVKALTEGTVRRQSDEPKAKKVKDPLVDLVTKVVERDLYDSKKADKAYTFLHARKEVGGDGIAYLNSIIEAKVAGGADRAGLEKMRDTKYINPAKNMLGLTTTKAQNDLPSIL
jgi:hypothetical protein